MKVRINYKCVNDKPEYKIKLKFITTFEWHYASLIAKHINEIFLEENILAYFAKRVNEYKEQCCYSISPNSYYYLLNILWHDGICKYDPNSYDYFDMRDLNEALKRT